jgi:hypothetical protein
MPHYVAGNMRVRVRVSGGTRLVKPPPSLHLFAMPVLEPMTGPRQSGLNYHLPNFSCLFAKEVIVCS